MADVERMLDRIGDLKREATGLTDLSMQVVKHGHRLAEEAMAIDRSVTDALDRLAEELTAQETALAAVTQQRDGLDSEVRAARRAAEERLEEELHEQRERLRVTREEADTAARAVESISSRRLEIQDELNALLVKLEQLRPRTAVS